MLYMSKRVSVTGSITRKSHIFARLRLDVLATCYKLRQQDCYPIVTAVSSVMTTLNVTSHFFTATKKRHYAATSGTLPFCQTPRNIIGTNNSNSVLLPESCQLQWSVQFVSVAHKQNISANY